MLRLRTRNPTERVNSGLLQTFLEMYSENRDGVTAMLSYEQVNVRNGSWLCENAKTLNRDRRSYSSKTALVAQGASGLNLEVGLENIILRCVSIFEFLHGQGQIETLGRAGIGLLIP
jgi:hypothetical protein